MKLKFYSFHDALSYLLSLVCVVYSRIPPRDTFGRTLMFFTRFAVLVQRFWSPLPAPLLCAIVMLPSD